MKRSPTTVLALFAHPDDAEFLCAGTLAHLAERGATLRIATMTAGDCGSTVLPPLKIARIRRKEAERAANMVRASYTWVGEKDLSIFYDRPTLAKVAELVRRANPALVLTHSPVDYMVDHETTSRLVQTACFGGTAPNYRTRAHGARARSLSRVPHLYYAEPFGGCDILGHEIRSNMFVDISSTLARKLEMLECHASQWTWLLAQQGIADHADVVRRMAARAGEFSGFGWAEGYRQHLGQGFPQDNLLAVLLGDLVRDAGLDRMTRGRSHRAAPA
jgi:N-acetylglucosamine malate deacetylase 1